MATGVGMATELYRVLVTGIPAGVHKELFVREQVRRFLLGEIVSVQGGTATNAIVTLQCQQGFSLRVPSEQNVLAGNNIYLTLYNLGTLHSQTTLSMGNVPPAVYQEFARLAGKHGVTFQPQPALNGFTLWGQIDSVYNLRAEVDSNFLMKIQPRAPQPMPSSTPRPVGSATPMSPSGSPSPSMPAHVIPTSFSGSQPKLDPTLPLIPSTVGAGSPTIRFATSFTPTSKIPPGSSLATPVSGAASPDSRVPTTAAATADTLIDGLPAPCYKPGDHTSHDPDNPLVDISVLSTKSPSPPPPADDTSHEEERPKFFTGLDPDALALVQKLPEGKIPGVEYDTKKGCVHIQLEGENEADEAISKFQDVYRKVLAHDRRFRAENVRIPLTCNMEDVRAEIDRFEQKYLFTAFVLDGAKRMVRVISQARQFDQAKQFLEEALQKLSKASASARDPAAVSNVIKFSHNRTLTLKKADIVKEKADVLVNAANGNLLHGSGVAGALNGASKGELQRHCDNYMRKRNRREVPVGEVAVTLGGGKLVCKHVIHAVGPEGYRHSQTQCEHLVKQAVCNTLKAAEGVNATSIVLPAISCGVFSVNKDLAACCIIDTILGFNYTKPSPILSDIRIVILDRETHSCFARHFEQRAKGRRASAPSRTLWEDFSNGDTGKCHADKECPICFKKFKSLATTKCGHKLCKECLRKAEERDPYCRVCQTPLRPITGTQPRGGSIVYTVQDGPVPGYEVFKTLKINYTIPDGKQGAEHPSPGRPYKGISRVAYLPFNQEGRQVFKLLEKAFEARLIFKIGTSATSGKPNVVVWGDIHHKTILTGGPQEYGYPDPAYLQTVTQILAAKGIVSD